MRRDAKILFYVLYPVSVAVASTGYWMAQKKTMLILFVLYSLARAVSRKNGEHIFLIVSIGFAALGLLQGVIPLLMYLYAAFSLVCFDVSQMEIKTMGSDETPALTHYRKIRFYPMISVVCAAVLTITVLDRISITIPFILLLILMIAAFFSINRLIHNINTQQKMK
jgi:hypothetical protein